MSGSFRLDIRKRVFTQRVDGHLNRLHRDIVMASNMPEFRKCLDMQSGTGVTLGDGAVQSQVLDLILVGLLQLSLCYDSVINSLVNSQGLGLLSSKQNAFKILICRIFENLNSSSPFRLNKISRKFEFSMKEKI